MKMLLFATPLGVVCANSRKDCRAILAMAGADPSAQIEIVRRARGVIFAVQAYIEPSTIDTHIEKFKWMGSDERRRELIKLRNLPVDYGPLFGTSEQEEVQQEERTDNESDNRSQGPT